MKSDLKKQIHDILANFTNGKQALIDIAITTEYIDTMSIIDKDFCEYDRLIVETNDALAKKISTVRRVINSQKITDKLAIAIKDVVAESGGHSLSSFSGDTLWQTREPINTTKIVREVMKVLKGELNV